LGLFADEKKIGRLDVAMHDAARVSQGKRFGNPQGQIKRVAMGKRTLLELFREMTALEPLHCQVRHSRFGEAVRHEPDYSRVLERGQELRFALESGEVGVLAIEDLE